VSNISERINSNTRVVRASKETGIRTHFSTAWDTVINPTVSSLSTKFLSFPPK